MLSFLKPRGELVELRGRQVVFLSEKRFRPKQQVQIRLAVPEEGAEPLTLPVKVLRDRPAPDGRWVVIAVVESLERHQDQVGTPLRAGSREKIRVTVLSDALPGFRCLTEDLSSGGFRADLEAELALGDLLALTFEFDEPVAWRLELKARVEWVRRQGGAHYQTGFSFSDPEQQAENLALLEDWLATRGRREMGRLFRKSDFLARTERVPRPEAPSERPMGDGQTLDVGVDAPPRRGLRIPFEGVLRGWAWEQFDEAIVVVIEDVHGVDHWLEFPDSRGFHARCRSRKVHLQGLVLLMKSPMIEAYSRTISLERLIHVQFLDDHARVCLDLVAAGVRVAAR